MKTPFVTGSPFWDSIVGSKLNVELFWHKLKSTVNFDSSSVGRGGIDTPKKCIFVPFPGAFPACSNSFCRSDNLTLVHVYGVAKPSEFNTVTRLTALLSQKSFRLKL